MQIVIDMVLGTDMKRHFPIMGRFDTLHRMGAAAAGEEHPPPELLPSPKSPTLKLPAIKLPVLKLPSGGSALKLGVAGRAIEPAALGLRRGVAAARISISAAEPTVSVRVGAISVSNPTETLQTLLRVLPRVLP